MTRNLKVLGLALMAVLAFGALTASGAAAQEKGWITSDGEVTLTGTENPGTVNQLNAFGASVRCPGSSYTGHETVTHKETDEGASEHGLLPAKFTHITLTPHYKEDNHNCTVPGLNWIATVDMNGCDYHAAIGNTIEEDVYGGTVDIECPDGKEIEVTLWTNATDHTNDTTKACVLDVPEQTGLTGAQVRDNNDGTLNLEGRVTGITVERTAQAGHPSALFCPNSQTANGSFDVDATVTGHDSEGKETEISLSD